MSKKQLRIFYFFILLFTFLLYGNSIKNGYALDDNYVTAVTGEQHNLKIEKGFAGIPEIFSSHYVESRQQNFEYRPLVVATFAVEFQFFGSNPHMSHFINVLLYALTCLLLFSILRRLFNNYHILFPFLATVLFIAHPLHTEVVANIKSRDELLSFLFGLTALFYSLKYTDSKKIKFIFSTIVFLFLALLCKKTAVLFLAVIPLTIYFFSPVKLKSMLLICVFPLAAYVFYAVLKKIMIHDIPLEREFVFFENPLFFEHGLLKRIPIALYTCGYYIKLLLVPYPLSCYYGYNAIPMAAWGSPLVLFSLIFHLGIGIFALIKIPKKNILSYCIVLYFIGIAAFANIVTPVVGIVGERFVYLASLGFCIAAAYFLLKLFKTDLKKTNTGIKNFHPVFIFLSLLILSVYSSKTISRNNDWKDLLTLLRHDVKNYGNSCNLHYLIASTLYPKIFNMANGEQKNAMIEEVSFHFKEAAKLMREGTEKYPKDFTTLNNLGTIYVNILNDAVSAQPIFAKVKAIEPGNMDGQYNFAYCYEKRNLPDSAQYFYEKMTSENIEYPLVYLRLHELYIKKQEYIKAINIDKKALSSDPEKIEFYINLGNSYILNKDTLSGLKYFEAATVKAPANSELLMKVAGVFRATGNKIKAEEFERKANTLINESGK